MRLLFVTQKINKNDAILGFVNRWVLEFSKNVEDLTIICLEKGEFDLPKNVKVLSLGKEEGISRIKYIFRFYKYILKERKRYDNVFVHMNPVYVVLGGFFWKILKKKIFMWYTHRNVDLKLKIAEKIVDKIFTASPESFRLKSDKVVVTGHGIDTEYFKCDLSKKEGNLIKIVHVGRITRIKNCDILIRAGEILKKRWNKKFKIIFIGSPVTSDDEDYFLEIKKLVESLSLSNEVEFRKSISNMEIRSIYCNADITVNLTPTGGVDKAVLESMSCGVPVFTSNQTFEDYFGIWSDDLIFEERNPEDLSVKIINIFSKKISDLKSFLMDVASNRASIYTLVEKLIKSMQ